MDTRWLEDFLALRETGNFTRAAERRYITQPAFSRRIRSLEDWLGVELIDRSTYPPRVNTLGERYASRVADCLSALASLRTDIRQEHSRKDTLVIATQASLSVSFCPRLVGAMQPETNGASIEMIAGNLYECMEEFLAGRSDFLLCYDSPEVNPMLKRGDLERASMGRDALIPVVSRQCPQSSEWLAPEFRGALGVIGYPKYSFFGQLIEQALTQHPTRSSLSYPFVTAHADAVRAMVLAGLGAAWLPKILVQGALDGGELAPLTWLPSIPLEIILLRSRDSSNLSAGPAWEAACGIG